jgi:DNA (cytosine-5)-methyltransferase 1
LGKAIRTQAVQAWRAAVSANATGAGRGICDAGACEQCASDQAYLRSSQRPRHRCSDVVLRAADLFSGCGGMSAGLDEAARRRGYRLDIRLAVDADADVLSIYRLNFPAANVMAGDVAELFDGNLGARPSKTEQAMVEAVGDLDIMLGGPPCQGHSDLNNHTRRRDPKNALYLGMARAAEVLGPKVVVVENVAPVQLDESRVVDATSDALTRAGYQVSGRVVDLRRVGVPQRRRRYLLLASKVPEVNAVSVLEGISAAMPRHPDRTLRWAIEDLVDIDRATIYDTPSRATKDNAERITYLFENRRYDLPNRERPKCHRDGKHSYVSMYGRLRWDRAAQTITTGFGCMGQGRYVHPARRRTITPHEAARLQTFPDWFDFGANTSRTVLAKMIGNAVPPLLMVALGEEIVRGLAVAQHQRGRSNVSKSNKVLGQLRLFG